MVLAAAVSPNESEEKLLILLRTKGLSIKDLDEERRAALRAMMQDLHVVRGVSLSDIAKMIGNKTSGYTSWLCRQLGVEARPFEEARLKGIREKRRKYERRPFDGTDEDKAYLLGLRHGDLSTSVPWKGVVRASTSTTHPSMAELFENLFSRYGHVYRYPRFKNDTKSYEWNLQVILDGSFDFLCWSLSEVWTWISDTRNRILSFIAGFLDAEGHLGISSSGKNTCLIISIYNTNLSLLQRIKTELKILGFSPLGPYLDKPKGSKTSKYGIERKKDYWRIALARFDECKALLRLLPLRHPEKLRRKELSLSLLLGQRWDVVAPRIQELRRAVKDGRDSFVREAETAVGLRRRQHS